MSLPIAYVEGNLAFCRDQTVWAGYKVEPNSYEFLTESEKWSEYDYLRELLWTTVEEGIFVRLCHETPLADYLKTLAGLSFPGQDAALAEAYKKRVDELGSALGDSKPRSRSYFLFLRLPGSGPSPGESKEVLAQISSLLSEVSGHIKSSFGFDPERIPASAIKVARDQEGRLRRHVAPKLWIEPMGTSDWTSYLKRLYRRGKTPPSVGAETRQSAAVVEGGDPIVRPLGVHFAEVANVVTCESPRHIEFRLGEEESFQSFLSPYRFPTIDFPGGEWIYELESLSFPVDVAVFWRIKRPLEAIRKAQGQKQKIEEQIKHTEGSGSRPAAELLEQLAEAEQFLYETKKTKEPEVYARTVFCVYDRSLEGVKRKGEELKNHYAPQGIELAAPEYLQFASLEQFYPSNYTTSPKKLALFRSDYTVPMSTGFLAASVFYATELAGDAEGPYLGHVDLGVKADDAPTGPPVLFDPTLPARDNQSSVIGVLGTPGGGKSETVKRIVDWLMLRGAKGLVFDPKGEYGVFSKLPEYRGRVERVVFRPGSHTLFDPLRSPHFGRDAGAQIATTFLSLLTQAKRSDQIKISEAVELEKESGNPSLRGAVGLLQRTHPDADVTKELLHFRDQQPLAQVAFGSDDPGSQELVGFDALLTVIDMRALQLPDREARGASTWDESLSLALLYLAISAGQAFVRREDTTVPRFFVIDEAWAIARTSEGRNLLFELERLARSANCVPILITQSALDLTADEDLQSRIVNRFVFRQEHEGEARACLKFLGFSEEEARQLARLLQRLPTGQCLFRDRHGRCAVVQVEQVGAELTKLFDTSPGKGKLAHDTDSPGEEAAFYAPQAT